MKTLIKSAAIAGLILGGAQGALAQRTPAPAATTGTVAQGIGVANLEAVMANSSAFRTAQQQRVVTYKPQLDAADARRRAITEQLRPLAERFNRERAAPTANTPAAQASLQQQAQNLEAMQNRAQQELQTILAPAALSEAYVQEQINDRLSQAIQTAMTKKNITLVLSPQSVLAASNSYNLNQEILNELNLLIPAAQLVPPTGWEPREIREQRAAAAAQSAPAAGAAPAATPPAAPRTDGR